MKKCILFIAITLCSLSFSIAQEKLNINTSKSNIKWSCDYAFYFGGHYGDVKFKEGYFIKTNETITGGEFIIDLNTITNTDIEDQKGNTSLVEHIKNEDFFEVNKFPEAKIVITNTRYHDKTSFKGYGVMTIKGISKPVEFQAKLDYKTKTMTTRFKIDRTLWGIVYGSSLKDKGISDAIGFEVSVSL